MEKNASRPFSAILAICFGISCAVHLITVIFVIYMFLKQADGGAVHYLELRSFDVPYPASTVLSPQPTISRPAVTAPPAPAPDSSRPTSAPLQNTLHEIQTTPLGRGISYGFVSSLADGATLNGSVREYYLVLVEKINNVWWERAGTLAEAPKQDGVIEIMVQRDGTLLAQRILRGTGSREADHELLEAIKQAAPLPQLPADYKLDVFAAPLKITAPSRLFRLSQH